MVIPADARRALGVGAGSKMVIFGSEGGRQLVLMRAETVTQCVAQALGEPAEPEAELREDSRLRSDDVLASRASN